jgi:hypothetical protein
VLVNGGHFGVYWYGNDWFVFKSGNMKSKRKLGYVELYVEIQPVRMNPTNYKMVPRAAVVRGDACQAIDHDKHDLSLRLTKEEDTNSVRQFTPEMLAQGNEIRKRYLANPKSVSQREINSVPTISYDFQETEDGYVATTVDYNSIVDVNEERLLNPSTSNGGKTSRYGKGRSIMIAKRDPTQGNENSATWHKGGDNKAYGYTGPDIRGRDIYTVATEPGLPSNDSNKSWFRSKSYIDKDTLEKANTPQQVGTIIREILLITTNQSNIDSVRRTIRVVDKSGNVVFDENSWDGRWKCWEEVVTTRNDLFKLWPKNRKEIGPNSFVETQHYKMLKEDAELAKLFPNYGHLSFADSRAFLFLGDEMVQDSPAFIMANLASHPASQTSYGVIVRFMNEDGTANNVDVLPTPATVKIQFLNLCKIFKKAVEAIHASRPDGWIKYTKSESPKKKITKVTPPPVVPVIPQPPVVKTVHDTYPDETWVDTTYGLSIEGEVNRNANESDTAYMKRIKTNRKSRESKKQQKKSATNSPASIKQVTETSSVEVPQTIPQPTPVEEVPQTIPQPTPVEEVPQTIPQPIAVEVPQVIPQPTPVVDEIMEWARDNLERLRMAFKHPGVLRLLE